MPRAHVVLLGSVLLLGSLMGCGSDRSFPLAPGDAQQYWALALNHHAVTLALTAPANQLQLTAVPLTAMSDTIATDARVHYTSSDSAVQVDSTGLLTAHSVKAGVVIIATLTVGGAQGLTLADTAEVNVNDVAPVPTFSRLTVQTPGDSAKLANGTNANLTIKMYDGNGTVISGTKYYVAVQDTTKAKTRTFASGGHWSNKLIAAGVGQTRVVVEATVYGVHKSDTLALTVDHPNFQTLSLELTSDTSAQLSATSLTVSPNGIIAFENQTQGPLDIIFDDSTTALGATNAQLVGAQGVYCILLFVCPADGSASGNIHNLSVWTADIPHAVGVDFRLFANPGTYPFHTRPFNLSGVIHVE